MRYIIYRAFLIFFSQHYECMHANVYLRDAEYFFSDNVEKQALSSDYSDIIVVVLDPLLEFVNLLQSNIIPRRNIALNKYLMSI